jgi:hypothetical protein
MDSPLIVFDSLSVDYGADVTEKLDFDVTSMKLHLRFDDSFAIWECCDRKGHYQQCKEMM